MIFTTKELVLGKYDKPYFTLQKGKKSTLHPFLFLSRHGSISEDRNRGAYWSGFDRPPPNSRILVPKEFC